MKHKKRRCAAMLALGAAAAAVGAVLALRPARGGTDRLTGAADRAAFRLALRRAAPVGGVVLARLPGLEGVNKEFGYRAGDELIIRGAEALRLGCGPGAALYRIGGRTFAAVLPQGMGETPREVAERSVRAFAPDASGQRLAVSWAAGPDGLGALLARAEEGQQSAD